MKFIGIDCAAMTGWAFKEDVHLGDKPFIAWKCGTVRADSQQKYDVLALAVEHGVTHACIEKPMPFLARGARGKTARSNCPSMSTNYGRWLEAFDRVGIVVVPCMVAEWQAAMLIHNGVRMRQNEKKEASLYIAKLHGALCRNGDEADAVCLAAYGPRALERASEKAEEKKVLSRAKAKAARAKR